MTRAVTSFSTAALCALLWLPGAAPASPLPALDAASAVKLALESDGARVAVEGEAIGEALRAPDGRRWVNVLSGGTAIGVVMTAQDAASVPRFGSYRNRGATLRVEGVLNVACDEHGGDLDLHASSVEVLDAGVELPHAIHPLKGAFAGLSALFVIALALRYRGLRRRILVV